MWKIYEGIVVNPKPDFTLQNGALKFRDHLCVPDLPEVQRQVSEEAHNTKFTKHPGGMKMYQDFRETFWWLGMKKERTEFVLQCLSTNQSRTSKTGGTTTIITNTGMEMEAHHYGFRRRTTKLATGM